MRGFFASPAYYAHGGGGGSLQAVDPETGQDIGTGIDYTYEGGVLTITGTGAISDFDNSENKSPFNGTAVTSVTISAGITGIGDYLFYGCTDLTSVTISSEEGVSGVTSIGDFAFYGCTGIASIELGSSLESIGTSAFRGCTGLTSVTLPDTVKSIGATAFRECSALVTLDVNWNNLEHIGSKAFMYDYSLKFTDGSITIGPNISSLGEEDGTGYHTNIGLWNLSEVTTLTVDPSNENFATGSNGYDSNWLYKLNGTDGTAVLYEIPNGALTGVTSVTIPESITWNGTTYTVTSIGETKEDGLNVESAIFAKSGITSVTIGDNITTIGTYAFRGCTGLTEIKADSVTYVDLYAFHECSNLKTVDMKSLQSMSTNHVFTDCDALETLVFTSIGEIFDYQFADYVNLKSVVLGSSTETIGNYAFRHCTSLETVTGEGATVSIGVGAFYQTPITTFDVGSVTSVGITAFYGCTSLTYIDLSDATSIGRQAFASCTSLKTVTLSTTSVGERAFYNCPALVSLDLSSISDLSGMNSSFRYMAAGSVIYFKDQAAYDSMPTTVEETPSTTTETVSVISAKTAVLFVNGGTVELTESPSFDDVSLDGSTAVWYDADDAEVESFAAGGVYHVEWFEDRTITFTLGNVVVRDASGTELSTSVVVAGHGDTVLYIEPASAEYALPGEIDVGTYPIVYSQADGTLTVTSPTEDMALTITAVESTAATYTVVFDKVSEDATETMDSQTIAVGTNTTLSANEFKLTGYSFKGWATTSGATTVVYEDLARVKDLTTEGGTITLYAVWEANTYAVTFHANDGTESTTTQDLVFGTPTALDANTFERTGYTFLGWATTSDATIAEYNDCASYTMAAEGADLYAVWDAIEYAITLDGDHVSWSAESIDVAYDTVLTFSEGKIVNSEGTALATYTITEGYEYSETLVGGVAATTLTVSGTATVSAVVTLIEYTVSFDSNGGAEVASQTVGYGNTVTKPETSRTDYTLIGWYTEDGSAYAFTESVTADLVLTAVWMKDTSGADTEIEAGGDKDIAVTVPTEVLSDAVASGGSLTIASGDTSVSFDAATVSGLGSDSALKLVVTDTAAVTGSTASYDLTLSNGSGDITGNFAGTVTVTLSVDVPSGCYAVVYYVVDGVQTEQRPTTYTATTVTFTAEHFSTYAVYVIEEDSGSVIIIPDDNRTNPSSATTSSSGSSSDDSVKIVACAAAAVAAALMAAFILTDMRRK